MPALSAHFELARVPQRTRAPDGRTALEIGKRLRLDGDDWTIAGLCDDGRIELRRPRDGAANDVRIVDAHEIDGLVQFDSEKVLEHPEHGPVDGWQGVGLVPRDGSARLYRKDGAEVWRTREEAVSETLAHRPLIEVQCKLGHGAIRLGELAARTAFVVDALAHTVATESAGAGSAKSVADTVDAALAHLEAKHGWRGWNGGGGVVRVDVNQQGEVARADSLRYGVLQFGAIDDGAREELAARVAERRPEIAAKLRDVATGYATDPSIVMHELVHLITGHVIGSYVPRESHVELLAPEQLRALAEAASVDEGLCDVLGACYAKSWEIGGTLESGAVRDLENGTNIDRHVDVLWAAFDNDPQKYDWHRGSGVLSHAALLMTRGRASTRLNVDDVERLYFGAIQRMGAWTFRDAGGALEEQARDLFGAPSPKYGSVVKSLGAVGLPG